MLLSEKPVSELCKLNGKSVAGLGDVLMKDPLFFGSRKNVALFIDEIASPAPMTRRSPISWERYSISISTVITPRSDPLSE